MIKSESGKIDQLLSWSFCLIRLDQLTSWRKCSRCLRQKKLVLKVMIDKQIHRLGSSARRITSQKVSPNCTEGIDEEMPGFFHTKVQG